MCQMPQRFTNAVENLLAEVTTLRDRQVVDRAAIRREAFLEAAAEHDRVANIHLEDGDRAGASYDRVWAHTFRQLAKEQTP